MHPKLGQPAVLHTQNLTTRDYGQIGHIITCESITLSDTDTLVLIQHAHTHTHTHTHTLKHTTPLPHFRPLAHMVPPGWALPESTATNKDAAKVYGGCAAAPGLLLQEHAVALQWRQAVHTLCPDGRWVRYVGIEMHSPMTGACGDTLLKSSFFPSPCLALSLSLYVRVCVYICLYLHCTCIQLLLFFPWP